MEWTTERLELEKSGQPTMLAAQDGSFRFTTCSGMEHQILHD